MASQITEKIELLGKGLYKDIPDVLTLKSLPTSTELDYVSAEDFDKVMLEKIFPAAIEEKINFNNLLEMDYYWICRCLRILNYGPYYTANTIFCPDCGNTSRGDFQVDLRTVDVKTLPENFDNNILISKDNFLDFDGDITVSLPTISKMRQAEQDSIFKDPEGRTNRELSRLCYMITSIKGKNTLTVLDIKSIIEKKLSAADYVILKDMVHNYTNYGLTAGGHCACPRCRQMNATFLALIDDRFFRPSLGDLKSWKIERAGSNAGDRREDEDVRGNKTKSV